jgi:hypothetical protein
MKTTVYILMFVLGTWSHSHGQFNQGNLQLGGKIGYSKNNLGGRPLMASDYENITLSVLPTVGKFLTPHTVLGIGIGYTNVKVKVQEVSLVHSQNTTISANQQLRSQQNLWLANPYLRTHRPIGESFAIFVEFNAGYGFGKGTSEQIFVRHMYSGIITNPGNIEGEVSLRSWSSQSFRQTIWGASMNPGISFFPSPRWGLDISMVVIGYTQLTSKIGDRTIKNSDLNLLTDFSTVSIGAKYYL